MLQPGDAAPPLQLVSASGQRLELNRLRGRRCLLWYEDRDCSDENRPLREALTAQRRRSGHAADLSVVAVADVQDYAWFPARAIVAAAIRGIEQREQSPVYCDWSGEVGRALDAPRGRSHLLVLDAAWRVEAAFVGPLDAAERDAIVAFAAPSTEVSARRTLRQGEPPCAPSR